MKTLNTYISERLVLSKNKNSEYTLFPETDKELKEMIESEIKKKGNACSLNHIDVSKITDMSKLFNEKPKGISPLQEYYFNCDISFCSYTIFIHYFVCGERIVCLHDIPRVLKKHLQKTAGK